MTIVMYKSSNIVFEIRPDDESYTIKDNILSFEGLRILDPTADKLEIIPNVNNVPSNFEPFKYKYINNDFVLNPDY